MPLRGGRRRPVIQQPLVEGTAVPGVERAPNPVACLCVRNVETPSGSSP